MGIMEKKKEVTIEGTQMVVRSPQSTPVFFVEWHVAEPTHVCIVRP